MLILKREKGAPKATLLLFTHLLYNFVIVGCRRVAVQKRYAFNRHESHHAHSHTSHFKVTHEVNLRAVFIDKMRYNELALLRYEYGS